MNQDIAYRDFDPGIFADSRTAVIDGDGFAYAIGWNHKDDIFEDGIRREVDDIIHDILQGTQSSHYVGILSPQSILVPAFSNNEAGDLIEETVDVTPNFRKAIAKSRPYKGHRKEKPEWYDRLCPVIEDQLVTKWGFVRTQAGYEADDMVVTMCTVITAGGGKAICCGNDKDLRQWSGEHFNVRTKLIDKISTEQAAYNLYTQVIIGDTTDNIQGLEGYGPKAAEKILVCPQPEGMLVRMAFDAYAIAYEASPDTAVQKFYENYMLVKLRTDLDIQCHEEELIHGYDLELYKDYNVVAPPDRLSDNEEIPDFFKGE